MNYKVEVKAALPAFHSNQIEAGERGSWRYAVGRCMRG